MAIFLKGSELNVALERLIKEADQCLFLISPYIKLHSRIKDELKHKKSSHKLGIVIVFGKCEEGQSNRINEEDLAFLKDFPNIQIRYEKNLHAKYYASEDCGLITSMNLYDSSQNNNIEVGVMTKTPNMLTGLVTSLVNTDQSLDFDSFRYFEAVIENSELLYHRVAHFEKGLFGLKETYVNSTVELDVIDAFFNKGYQCCPVKI